MSNESSWLDWTPEAIAAALEAQPAYVYTSGIKDLQVRYRDFEPAAALVTNPIAVDGNVVSVGLSAEADCPATASIEYYVCFTETPTAADWLPILPSAAGRTVTREKLFANGAKGFLPLRFAPDPASLSVLCNGRPVPPRQVAVSNDCITIGRAIDPQAVYLASYTVAAARSPNTIVIPDRYRQVLDYQENGQPGQVFPNGTDVHGSVYLAKTPYYRSAGAAYSPVQVSLYGKMTKSTGSAVYATTSPLVAIPDYSQNQAAVPQMRNMTDYTGSRAVQLAAYDPAWASGAMTHPVFEYLQNGRQLTFTETFHSHEDFANNSLSHGNGRLVVQYQYLDMRFRAKIILRNLQPGSSTTTPVLKQLSLVFNVQDPTPGGA
jgi:hypothetical protein